MSPMQHQHLLQPPPVMTLLRRRLKNCPHGLDPDKWIVSNRPPSDLTTENIVRGMLLHRNNYSRLSSNSSRPCPCLRLLSINNINNNTTNNNKLMTPSSLALHPNRQTLPLPRHQWTSKDSNFPGKMIDPLHRRCIGVGTIARQTLSSVAPMTRPLKKRHPL
jgi:hypothetical protein